MFIKHFDHFADFVTYAAEAKSLMPANERISRRPGLRSWTGVSSFAEAVKLAKDGWPDGAARMKASLAAVEMQVMDHVARPDVVFDVIGEEIEMGAFVEGRPDCWLDWVEGEDRKQDNGEAIRIVVNLTASAGVSTEMLFIRGAAIAALTIGLERAGRRVEVTIGTNTKDQCIVTAVAKHADEPLQVDQLAFALANASCYRSLMFSAWETAPLRDLEKAGIFPNHGYGRCAELTDQGDIYLGSADMYAQPWASEKEALKWVMDTLKAQGVNLE